MRIVMNKEDQDVTYEDFPRLVSVQYFTKEGQPTGTPVQLEFYTLASYLLWAMTVAHDFKMGSNEYSEFAYFAATRPLDKPLKVENQYVIRSYEFKR